DLRRRDFTVNAVAVPLGGARRGELRTAPHALEDLAAGRLRVLHERSFIDDPTRLLRLGRYHTRLGFALENATGRLAAGALASVPSFGSPSQSPTPWPRWPRSSAWASWPRSSRASASTRRSLAAASP